MKSIKSLSDIEALEKAGCAEAVVVLITNYFSKLMGVYGQDYDASEGFCILLEKGDPITDEKFLEEQLCIRGGKTYVNVNEFLYHLTLNLFTSSDSEKVYHLCSFDNEIVYHLSL